MNKMFYLLGCFFIIHNNNILSSDNKTSLSNKKNIKHIINPQEESYFQLVGWPSEKNSPEEKKIILKKFDIPPYTYTISQYMRPNNNQPEFCYTITKESTDQTKKDLLLATNHVLPIIRVSEKTITCQATPDSPKVEFEKVASNPIIVFVSQEKVFYKNATIKVYQ